MLANLADESWSMGLPLDKATRPIDVNSTETRHHHHSHNIWVSRLLMLATRLSPSGCSASAWFKMASWCYSRGDQLACQSYKSAVRLLGQLRRSSSSPAAGAAANTERLAYTEPTPHLVSLLQPDEYSDLVNSLSSFCSSSSVLADNCDLGPAILSAILTFRSPLLLSGQQKDNDNVDAGDSVDGSSAGLLLHSGRLCPDDDDEGDANVGLEAYLRLQLPESLLPPDKLSSDTVAQLRRTARLLTERRYTLQVSAAQAYATYLTIAGQHRSSSVDASPAGTSRLDTTTATLKLLDMLSLPSRQLRSLIASFLTHGCPAPSEAKDSTTTTTTLGGPSIWQSCLDQVLTRLALPDPATRDSLLRLLQNLIGSGGSSPRTAGTPNRFAAHLVYPSVVAMVDVRNSDKLIPTVGDVSKSAVTPHPQQPQHNACFSQLIATLREAGYTGLINDVETFVCELQRINLLWDELWLGTLRQHCDELQRKMSSLKTDYKRLLSQHQVGLNDDDGDLDDAANIPSLLLTKLPTHIITVLKLRYAACIQSTLDLVNQLSAVTLNVQAETPHEIWFQRTFRQPIAKFESYLVRPVNVLDITALANSFRDLLKCLREPLVASSPTSASPLPQLSLKRISPKLASMQFGGSSSSQPQSIAGVPLPGHLAAQAVSLVDSVLLYPTKTRPKRLLFRGQNGRSYSYLLKGLEDLRLDDRVMRLFDLVGLAYSCQQQSTHSFVPLRLRTYSVTPLGVRCGLIQMVQGASSLFSIYKHWQSLSTNTAANSNDSTSSYEDDPNIGRPVKMYQDRVKQQAQTLGLPNGGGAAVVKSRTNIEFLRSVLDSLEAEVPHDLLSRELWAANSSNASWWQVSQTFARSTGLTSILGYLVGLGDRHLENLLVDFSTGHVIHIDFNVCFEKGRTLSVAERVPFRLTRIIRHALGPIACWSDSVNGTFRFAAEHALETVRSLVDPLLIQLKAFLVDPLSDWCLQQEQRALSPQVAAAAVVSSNGLTHLSAYLGGGSCMGSLYRDTLTRRRLSRIEASIRHQSGLLLASLYEATLSSPCLLTSISVAIDKCNNLLSHWSKVRDLQANALQLKKRQRAICKASSAQFTKSEARCLRWEVAEDSLVVLRESLDAELASWCDCEVDNHLATISSRLVDSICFNKLLKEASSLPAALIQLIQAYASSARLYLTDLDSLTQVHRLACVKAILDRASDQLVIECKSELNNLPVAASEEPPLSSPAILVELRSNLKHVQHSLKQLEQQSHSRQSVDGVDREAITGQLVTINDLVIVPYAGFGVTAYSLGLFNHCVELASTLFNLELVDTSSNGCLDQLYIHTDGLASALSLLPDPFFGLFNFPLGMEADLKHEILLFQSIRSVVECLLQLRTNLTRLILPEAIDIMFSCSFTDSSRFIQSLLDQVGSCAATDSGSLNLSDRIASFLSESSGKSVAELRLHQLLLSVHLTLTNTCSTLAECSTLIQVSALAVVPAWCLVDLVCRPLQTLNSRVISGATSLWGWSGDQSAATNTTTNQSQTTWNDEVYVAGLMAFASVLDELRSHIHVLKAGHSINDNVLLPHSPTATLTHFVSCLTGRLALPSLASFASARLACALTEYTLCPLSQLVSESAGGLIINLSAMDRLGDFYAFHYGFDVYSSGLFALRDSAYQYIHNVLSLTTRVDQSQLADVELDSQRRYVALLQRTCQAFVWLHQPSSTLDGNEPAAAAVGGGHLVERSLVAFLDDLDSCLSTISEDSASTSPLLDLAKAVSWFERMRIRGPSSLPIYQRCTELINQLEDAVLERDQALADLTEFDSTMLSIKSQFGLAWPCSNWLSTLCSDDPSPPQQQRTVRSHLEHAVKTGDQCLKQANLLLTRAKRDLNSTQLPDQLRTAIGQLLRDPVFNDLRSSVKSTSALLQLRSSIIGSSRGRIDWASLWSADLDRWRLTCVDFIKQLIAFIDKLACPPLAAAIALIDDYGGEEFRLADALLRAGSSIKSDFLQSILYNLAASAGHEFGSSELVDSVFGDLVKLLDLAGLETKQEASVQECSATSINEEDGIPIDRCGSPRGVNSKAVSVVHRIHARLTGVDRLLPHPPNARSQSASAAPLTVADQVDACIRASIDRDNLALMYEGWAAWV